MRCPFCGANDTQVKDSRPVEDGIAIRRRRFCAECGSRFTTFERVQFCEITVVKKNDERVPFDRDKLSKSIYTAVRKRGMSPEQVDRVVSGIVRKIETMGEAEITTAAIGELVLDALKGLDTIAYIRFASVYKDFKTPEDFDRLIQDMNKDEGG